MIILKNGHLYDPTQKFNGKKANIYIENGRIIRPKRGLAAKIYDLKGRIVMAGAIDIHSHIAGGKVAAARAMHPEFRNAEGADAVIDAAAIGARYTLMGFTTVIEPAMPPASSRRTHMELGMVPFIDKGAYVVLGNDDYLLSLIAKKAAAAKINDYVAWTLESTKALGVKVINPGGVDAFKWGVTSMNLEDRHPHYQITPAKILQTLLRAVTELGVRHPLHVHTCNIGVPGNFLTTARTIELADGLPIHLTHVQFHSYGDGGDRGFSSAAAEMVEQVALHKNVTVDVGQVMFGQTITISGDEMHQHRGRRHASPKKWAMMDLALEGGAGIVPIKYKPSSFANATQWACGLELFLLNRDPWRLMMTTDHPNGAPFTAYPELIGLLLDADYRHSKLAEIHPSAAKMSLVGSINRQYGLYELATMTRSAPAALLGLRDRGHLKPGAVADIAIYENRGKPSETFKKAAMVFKDGELVVENGRLKSAHRWGRTLYLQPQIEAKDAAKYLKDRARRFADSPIRLDEFLPADGVFLKRSYQAERRR